MWRSNALYFIEKLRLKYRRAHWEALSYRLCSLAGGVMLSQLQRTLLGMYLFTIFQTIFLLLWLPATNHSLLPQPLSQSQLWTTLSLLPCLLPHPFSFIFDGSIHSFSSTSLSLLFLAGQVRILRTPQFSPLPPNLHGYLSLPSFLTQCPTHCSPSFSCGLTLPKHLQPSTLSSHFPHSISLVPLLYDTCICVFIHICIYINGFDVVVGLLGDSVLPVAYLAYFSGGIKLTETQYRLGHVAKSSLGLQAQIMGIQCRRPQN